MIRGIRVSLIHLLFITLCAKVMFAKPQCIKEEKEALLNFKYGVKDSGRLKSWNDEEEEDCCKWIGIRCSNITGHVVMLALPARIPSQSYDGDQLHGNISSSLLELRELKYLDLSYNDFLTIPKFIGSLTNLEHLNLFSSLPSFYGTVPHELGNLTKLQYLNVGENNFIELEKIEWLSKLRNLKHLDLSFMHLNYLTNWVDVIDMLPSLEELYIRQSYLPNVTTITSNYPLNSSKSLAVVDLSYNFFSSSVYPWLLKYTSLRKLDLSYSFMDGSLPDFTKTFKHLTELSFHGNLMGGTFPQSFGQISPLIHLDLSFNSIGGPLPDLDVFPFLRTLNLAENRINGALPEGIGQLSELELFDASSNLFEGKVSEVHLSNLSKLKHLDLSYNSLSFEMSDDWIPTFQLNTLRLSSCNLGPRFPSWLDNQNNLSVIDISRTGISDRIPTWFWDLSFRIRDLNLSHNQIHGTIPDLSSTFSYFPQVDLSSNHFSGAIPILPSNVSSLDLSKNMFSGSIKSSLCGTTSVRLFVLDLSDNLLSETLPDCFLNLQSLLYLNIESNRFIGGLPQSIGSLIDLQILNIRNNSISGQLPFSLRNCTSLRLLDLGENQLSGEIPHWLGGSLPYLLATSFRSNKFYGTLPLTLCSLEYIQILDLSTNNISGTIPNCINGFTALVVRGALDGRIDLMFPDYVFGNSLYYPLPHVSFSLSLEWKGRPTEYETTLGLVKIIDLSNNKLTGEIPDAITSLAGLVALNLSRNNLTGTILSNISQLRWLDFLDLSNNDLSGQIPIGLTQLSNLAVLDLSNNNLSGRIPTSTQLQSFRASAYMGNLDLCGPPLTISCNNNEGPQGPTVAPDNNEDDGSEDDFLTFGFYVSIVLGFASGFWGFMGTLFLKRKWRYAYFRHLNAITDRVYVTCTLKMTSLRRKI